MLDIENLSYWEKKTFFEDVDYLIIGAGIVGYSTALNLRKLAPCSKIVIIERGFLPSGASSKNAGFSCFGSATELISDLKTMPESEVWETVSRRWEGLQKLRETIGDDNLKLETNGSWDLITDNDITLYNETISKLNYLNTKIESITGEKNVYTLDENCNDKFGMKSIHSSIFNRLEGQIDTSKMNSTFFKEVIKKDIHVLFGLEAQSVDTSQREIKVQTNKGTFISKKAAICTNGFASQLLPKEDVQPARAQVLITKPIKGLKIKGTFHYDQGYFYFRNIDDRVLLGGGRNLDFKVETTTEMENTEFILNHLKTLLKNVILPNTEYEIDYEWAGIMGVGESKKPIIKKIENNLFCGVRLGGMGVAIGSLVGNELAELIHSK